MTALDRAEARLFEEEDRLRWVAAVLEAPFQVIWYWASHTAGEDPFALPSQSRIEMIRGVLGMVRSDG